MSCGEISDFYTRQMKINLKFSTSVMWRHLRFLHMTDVEKYEITPHEEKFLQNTDEEKYEILHICQVEKFLHMTDMEKSEIYAIFLRNKLCRDLRTFVWRKMEPTITYVEKK